MGPKQDTREYGRQVETITTALRHVPMLEHELPRFLMLYITDVSYSRGAICEAERNIRHERGWAPEGASGVSDNTLRVSGR